MKAKMRRNFNRLTSLLVRNIDSVLISMLKRGIFDQYQPLYGEDASRTASTAIRSSEDRVSRILELDYVSRANSVIDIGCNIGFFSLNVAKEKNFVLGVDGDGFDIKIAKRLSMENDIFNAHFIQAFVDKTFVENMPQFDVCILLSVFHHWVKSYGQDEAREMLTSLTSRVKLGFIFETGQPDESDTSWAHQMQFIGEIDEWVHNFFPELGFEDIELIGEYETGLSSVKRKMFSIKRTSWPESTR